MLLFRLSLTSRFSNPRHWPAQTRRRAPLAVLCNGAGVAVILLISQFGHSLPLQHGTKHGAASCHKLIKRERRDVHYNSGIFLAEENRFSVFGASRGRSYYQNPSRKLPGYRTLLLDEFQHGIFHMDPFRANYYSFLDPQKWPKLSLPSPALPKPIFFEGRFSRRAFCDEK